MIKLIVSTLFMLNFLAARVHSECEFSHKKYQRIRHNGEFSLYIAKKTANSDDLNFSEYKCDLVYDHEYFENANADRWFECTNKMMVFESVHAHPANKPTDWYLKDLSQENINKVPDTLPLRVISSSEAEYYPTNLANCSLITQELITDFVYEDTANQYLKRLIFRLKRRYQFQLSPREEENYPYI